MSAAAIADHVAFQSIAEPAWRPRPVRARSGSGLGGQAGTIREMLLGLGTLTTAGQRHSMNKIVDFLAKHVPGAGYELGRRNKEALVRLIEALRRESERPLPEIALFSHQTENILALMSAVA